MSPPNDRAPAGAGAQPNPIRDAQPQSSRSRRRPKPYCRCDSVGVRACPAGCGDLQERRARYEMTRRHMITRSPRPADQEEQAPPPPSDDGPGDIETPPLPFEEGGGRGE